jgi:hypothetical protein
MSRKAITFIRINKGEYISRLQTCLGTNSLLNVRELDPDKVTDIKYRYTFILHEINRVLARIEPIDPRVFQFKLRIKEHQDRIVFLRIMAIYYRFYLKYPIRPANLDEMVNREYTRKHMFSSILEILPIFGDVVCPFEEDHTPEEYIDPCDDCLSDNEDESDSDDDEKERENPYEGDDHEFSGKDTEEKYDNDIINNLKTILKEAIEEGATGAEINYLQRKISDKIKFERFTKSYKLNYLFLSLSR